MAGVKVTVLRKTTIALPALLIEAQQGTTVGDSITVGVDLIGRDA